MSSSMLTVAEARKKAQARLSSTASMSTNTKQDLTKKSEAELREILLELQEQTEDGPKMILIQKINNLKQKLTT